MAAARAAVRLFDLMGPQDVGDPAALQSAIAATFAGFPSAVFDQAPVVIAQRSDRLTLKLVTAVCDEIYAPIERQLERDRAAQSHRLGLPAPSTKRTPEQQARVDAQVAAFRKQMGIPDDPPKESSAA